MDNLAKFLLVFGELDKKPRIYGFIPSEAFSVYWKET